MLTGKILGNDNKLQGNIQAQVIETGTGGGGIEIDGAVTDKGFLRFKGSNGHFETILPDTNIDGDSDNMIANSAVFNYVNQVANSVSDNFYSKPEVDGIVENIYYDADNQFYNKEYIDDIVEDVGQSLNNVIAVAEGKTKSFTVPNLYQLGILFNIDTNVVQDSYVIPTTTIYYKGRDITLNQGDLFLIVDVGVPDYWVSVDDMRIYKMETTKVDLSGYVTYEQYQGGFSGLANTVYQNQDRIGALEGQQVTLTQTQYDNLVANGAINPNVYYNIVEG